MRVSVLCSLAYSLAFVPSLLTPVKLWSQAPSTPTETSNLSVATIRQALADERSHIAAHPNDPQTHIDLAYTLVDAGATGQAIREMRRPVELAPKSAHVYDAQGWVLTHNSIGLQYGKGFDYEAAAAAYRTAIALDASDLEIRSRYAELLEYNRDGMRYAADAKLDESIEIRRYVVLHQGAEATADDVDNLLIALFYSGRFADVLAAMQNIASSPKRDGIQLSAIAALKGSAAALEAASHISDEAKRRDALLLAAVGLWNMRLYPLAADMLTASLPDPSGSNHVTGQIQIFKNLQPYRGVDLPPTDPRYPLQLLMVSMITGTLSESVLDRCVSSHLFVDAQARKNSLGQVDALEGKLQALSRQIDLPRVVLNDIILAQIRFLSQPSHGEGAGVMMQIPGISSIGFYTLSVNGSFKIVAGDDSGSAGMEALFLLNHQQTDAAIALLDWKRDRTENDRGDDPLGGSLFARIWQPGKKHDAATVKLAAASLLTDKTTTLALLPEVLTYKTSAPDAAAENLDLLLATMYLRTEDAANAKIATQHLLTSYPGSLTAALLAGQSYELSKDWTAWTALLDAQLQQHPANRLLLLQSVREAELQGDFSRARSIQRSLLDSGHALSTDQNTYAWLSLFEDKPDELAMQAMEQATLSMRNNNYAFLHTLACLHAARGETALARQFLLDAMSASGLTEPDSAAWFGFGRIYEQYGLYDAALEAYKRVQFPSTPEPDSTFVLAQRRIHLLAMKAAL